MYNELDLSRIKARGWIKEYLETQANGLTGEIGNVGEPFSKLTWEQIENNQKTEDNFLGGLNSKDDSWVPYEQNGYWIDGAIRAGHLADNQKLLDLARSKIYPAVNNPAPDGYIGPEILKDGLSWPFAVWYRALIAEYTATKNPDILSALKNHFLRKPLTDAYKREDYRIIMVRSVVDIETALWIYGQTGDERFLKMSEDSYEEFNKIFSDDSTADPNCEMFDVSLKGLLSNRKVQRNHGVTYCEVCKLAAVLYKYTGKEIYKKAAINAFEKLYRDQMLVDGVASSTEYLNGNDDSWAAHETCVVSDQIWALGYVYMITGDAKYGDRIENAVFNAGFGSIDDEFKGHQYFSCPNQVLADDTSNHSRFYRGKQWTSFAPKKMMGCCAGNVHRIVPNFVARSWMQDGDKVFATVYTPTEVTLDINGNKVVIEEITNYPFENTVKFKIHADNPTEFSLVLRKPEWANSADITVNGNRVDEPFKSRICTLKRTYKDSDEVVISFTDSIKVIENAKGISVKKGALLYALPIKEKVVVEGLRELGNPDFPHYSLYADSKWNYGLSVKDLNTAKFTAGSIGKNPWKSSDIGHTISVTVREVKDWKLKKVKGFRSRLLPRAKCEWIVQDATFTPKVKPITEKTPLGEKQTVELVPYCTTRLRIAIFPKIDK